MFRSKLKPSDKLHIIDRATFEEIQQQNDILPGVQKIRNSKYKKTRPSSGFNLLNFVIVKKKKPGRKRKVGLGVKTTLKKRGKTREGGHKKPYSRLKKSILRYRQKKRLQDQQESICGDAVTQLEALSLKQHTGGEDKARVHSRRFRLYCDNCTTARLGQLTEEILRDLDRFQKRAFAQNEIKARAHRRFVVGFRETQNFLRINKAKLIIIAPDCEECQGEAGLDEMIASIKTQCQDQQIPYVFSLRRRQLAYTLYKKVPVSCVAILDYDGAREIFAQLLDALAEARDVYLKIMYSNKALQSQVGGDVH